MENSILTSTKKILGITEEYNAFDLDIITHINSTFSILQQLGVGPEGGFSIEDASSKWSDYILNDKMFNIIRSYMFLRVRMVFDPPSTSFTIEAMNKQISEYEFRISTHREWLLDPTDPMVSS